MNNFAKYYIIQQVELAVKKNWTVKAVASDFGAVGAAEFMNKSDFMRYAFIPALEELNNGCNVQCVCFAAKVLAKLTDEK